MSGGSSVRRGAMRWWKVRITLQVLCQEVWRGTKGFLLGSGQGGGKGVL